MRTAVTDRNGVYSLRALGAGTYAVAFGAPAFQPSTRTGVTATTGVVTHVDAIMSPANVTETVTVTAEAPPSVTATTTSQTYEKREVDALPVGRRLVDIAELAPGLTNNTFAAGQLIIGGAFGFDNLFMVDGVDVNENIFGSANDLFIEDAIQETTVQVHGISAAYGRFSGGAVNVVTRSGGNTFGGSFRQNLSNPAWIAETPRQELNGLANPSRLGRISEGTFGGPLLQDRLWFFTAARHKNTAAQNTFAQTGGAYTRTVTNRRGELKLTATPVIGHSVQTTYINNSTEQENTSGLPLALLVDPSTLYTRQLPNQLFAARYNGLLFESMLATLQYSHKKDGRRNNGG